MSRTAGRRKYRASNSTQAAFALTETDYAATRTSGELTISDGTNTHVIYPMYGFRGCRIYFYGVGDNDAQVNYRVWGVTPDFTNADLLPNPISDPAACGISPIITDTSTFTLGTQTGLSTNVGLVSSSEKYADTVTFTLSTTATTPDGPGEIHEGAYALGTADAYSAAANTKAHLVIPHVGDYWGIVIEGDLQANMTSWNALIEFTGPRN